MDEGRVVVTEDVTTFSAAIALVPDHVGVVYCHHARFPRTRPRGWQPAEPAGRGGHSLRRLHDALLALAHHPPPGLGKLPVVWWLAAPED